ncbi:hypothetical protein AMK59_2813 [Oryctes borbonicus]|uniref:Adenosine 3'-phospho 5'-phosphosulfate transporter 1 n=1 Tax=Oryctes borbonicus TaxID=1629725 RepID=A0A0T6BGJ3_9SCAR|nr:hypothetical protein AMK59_2813 [Oryctes borbonicus]
MAKAPVTEVIICFIFISTASVIYFINKLIVNFELFGDVQPGYSWIVHCITNVLGYLTILLPVYFIYKYINKINYVDKPGSGRFAVLLRRFYGEDESLDKSGTVNKDTAPRTALNEALLLTFYFAGLQISFLSWGVLQEKIMTQKYLSIDNEEGHFKDSQFLVFVNRILAFCTSGFYIFCKRQPRHKCPYYKYIFCSLSNIMSSWCQYEALKYVSFLHQVLAKAAKTIPVIIMGKIVSRIKYEYYEYVTAGILSIGMLFFLLDAGDNKSTSTITTFSGLFLLCSYIVFDSFTSNWQGALFTQFGMSPVQMMCTVNFFSCIFTATSLLQQDGFSSSINFMIKYPAFTVDCILLSICSAGGQLFIFNTLSTFGPLVFAIISTIRQGFSVLLSCIIYQHHVGFAGVCGILLVFCSIFLRLYCSYRVKALRKSTKIINDMKV